MQLSPQGLLLLEQILQQEPDPLPTSHPKGDRSVVKIKIREHHERNMVSPTPKITQLCQVACSHDTRRDQETQAGSLF